MNLGAFLVGASLVFEGIKENHENPH